MTTARNNKRSRYKGFTIIELVIVVIIIGILAGIALVSYRGIQRNAAATAVKSDLKSAVTILTADRTNRRSPNYATSFPAGVETSPKVGLALTDTGDSRTFCINGSHTDYSDIRYYYDSELGLKEGQCDGEVIATTGEYVSGNGGTVASIAAGTNNSCAVSAGKVYCWGSNSYGQLGNNSTTASSVPVAVDASDALDGQATEVTVGFDHVCALAGGKVYCWGSNSYGQLGNNSTTKSLVPVAVDTSGVLSGKTVTAIDAGGYHTCALAGGQVYCWGLNGSGQLGDNTKIQKLVPVAVDTSGVLSGKTVTAISAGHHYQTCAIASGAVYCWGNNANGQLGDGSTTQRLVPVAVDTSGVLSGKTVTAITVASAHTCALAGGKVYCWGYNHSGQLGDGSTTQRLVPVAVDTGGVLSGKTVKVIGSAWYTTCAIASGTAYCWGDNFAGTIGDNATSPRSYPVAVYAAGALAGKTMTAINGGANHVCAIGSDQVYCWGSGGQGQLGTGGQDRYNSPVPVAVAPF